ncbi:hypothetical protein RCL1_002896 [Eukaryota sp. TZLM3-RCL]
MPFLDREFVCTAGPIPHAQSSPTSLCCGHHVCKVCISAFAKRSSCPICSFPLGLPDAPVKLSTTSENPLFHVLLKDFDLSNKPLVSMNSRPSATVHTEVSAITYYSDSNKVVHSISIFAPSARDSILSYLRLTYTVIADIFYPAVSERLEVMNSELIRRHQRFPETAITHPLYDTRVEKYFLSIDSVSKAPLGIVSKQRGTTLHDLLQNNDQVLSNPENVKIILFDIIRALSVCHESGKIYGLLTLHSIYIETKNGKLFGFLKFPELIPRMDLIPNWKNHQYLASCASPSIFLNTHEEFSIASDLFQLAIILIGLFLHVSPIHLIDPDTLQPFTSQKIQQIRTSRGGSCHLLPFLDKIPFKTREIVSKCLSDCSDITATDVCAFFYELNANSPYFLTEFLNNPVIHSFTVALPPPIPAEPTPQPSTSSEITEGQNSNISVNIFDFEGTSDSIILTGQDYDSNHESMILPLSRHPINSQWNYATIPNICTNYYTLEFKRDASLVLSPYYSAFDGKNYLRIPSLEELIPCFWYDSHKAYQSNPLTETIKYLFSSSFFSRAFNLSKELMNIVPLDYFINHSAVKRLNCSEAEIIESLEKSNHVEFHPSFGIKRKSLHILPLNFVKIFPLSTTCELFDIVQIMIEKKFRVDCYYSEYCSDSNFNCIVGYLGVPRTESLTKYTKLKLEVKNRLYKIVSG